MVLLRGGIQVIWVCALCFSQGVQAGRLGDLEKKASKKSDAPVQADPAPAAQPRIYESSEPSSFGSGTYPSSGESFFGGMMGWLISAPFRYRHDDPAAGGTYLEEDGWAQESSPRMSWGRRPCPMCVPI